MEKTKKKPAVKKTAVAAKPPAKPAKAPAKTPIAAKPMVAASKALPKAATTKISDPKKTAAAKASAGKAVETPATEPAVKRPTKLFFMEVKPGTERVIKRGDKTLAAPAPVDLQARRKDASSEETPEELAERIDRELQHQSFFKRTSIKPQMCTKCGINAVVERFTIDRELGYCESCAEILRLGATKEARRMEFNPSVKKENDGEGAAAGEDAEEAPAEGDEEAVPDID